MPAPTASLPDLLLIAHGSSTDPAPADAARRHADALQASGRFRRVHLAFMRQPPLIADVLPTLAAPLTLVLPLFLSHGWFTRRSIPAALGLPEDPPLPADHLLPHTRLRLLPGPGAAAELAGCVVAIAAALPSPAPPEQTALLLAGHGTARSARSAEAAEAAAAALRAAGRFASVHVGFLDQAPTLADALEAIHAPQVVVLPLLTSAGPHTRIDLPQALGLAEDPGPGPHDAGRHTLTLAPPVGEHPRITALLLQLVAAHAGA